MKLIVQPVAALTCYLKTYLEPAGQSRARGIISTQARFGFSVTAARFGEKRDVARASTGSALVSRSPEYCQSSTAVVLLNKSAILFPNESH